MCLHSVILAELVKCILLCIAIFSSDVSPCPGPLDFLRTDSKSLSLALNPVADSKGGAVGTLPQLAHIIFKKPFFPCKRHIFRCAHLR